MSTLRRLFARRWTRLLLATIALLTMTVMLLGATAPDAALAWDNCPKGLVNDPYPGRCGRYVDTNGDDICDLSQSKPVASTTTTLPVTTTEVVTTSTTDPSGTAKATVTTVSASVTAASGEPPTGDCPLGPCIGCRACVSIAADVEDSATIAPAGVAGIALAGSTDDDNTGSGTAGGGAGTTDTLTAAQTDSSSSGGASLVTHYLVGPIALGFFFIYGLSWILYKLKKIRISTHRKIWNVMLLGTFLVTGIFGLILAIQLDYTLPFTIPIDLLFWHVEAGIAMTLISLFHLGWHFNYYKNLIRNTRTKVRETRAAERDAARRPLADEGLLTSQAREERRALRQAERARRLPAGSAGGQPAQPRTSAKPNPWIQPETE